MAEVVFKEESYKIMGACFEVYKEKGCGFVEPVYQECLALELSMQQLGVVQRSEILSQQMIVYRIRPSSVRYMRERVLEYIDVPLDE